MLSQSNIAKLNMHGLYRHKPDRSMRSTMFYNDMYHCMNWTFYPVYSDRSRSYWMVDTYFQNKSFELDDNNFDEYEFVFDRTKVRKVSGDEADLYDKYYCVADDSGGISYPHYYVDSDAEKSNIKVIESLEREIESLESRLEYKKCLLEQERIKWQEEK